VTIDQTIALLSSMGTCITAIFIFVTLLEMSRQRKSTYLPDLFPATQFFYAKTADPESLNIPTNWTPSPDDDTSEAMIYLLNFHNIGNGAAKNIEFCWNIDLKHEVDRINKLCIEYGIKVKIEIEDDTLLNIIENGEFKITVGSGYSWEINIDHLLPSSIDNTGTKVMLPLTYIILSSIVIKLHFKQVEQGIAPQELIFPWLGLTLSYNDIGGNKHIKAFNVSAESQIYSIDEFQGQLNLTQTFDNNSTAF